MVVFPLAATAVAAVFTVATWRASGGRPSLRVWSIALAQFAIASGALAWGIGFGWTPIVYRTFYLFGAVLNVAWLALGTIWQTTGGKTPLVIQNGVIGMSFFASFVVLTAAFLPAADAALAVDGLPDSSLIMPIEARVASRVVSSLGSVVLLVGLILGIRRRRGTTGLILIAVGVVIVALVSTLARAGAVVEAFSAGLVVGVTVMFVGFLQTRRR